MRHGYIIFNFETRTITTARPFNNWDLIHTQHHHNNHTTIPHMRVGPSVWGPPSCEGLLCDCCVGVVNLTFSLIISRRIYVANLIMCWMICTCMKRPG